jgi:uncharacterized protein YlaI
MPLPLEILFQMIGVLVGLIVGSIYMAWRHDAPIKMILFCPVCHHQHIDAPEPGSPADYLNAKRWTNPPHKTHLCHGCGNLWKPSLHATEGVRYL